MATKKKLLEIDVKALEVLEKQAKLTKRSLKSYLEYMIEDRAKELAEPSEEYKAMMDDMIERDKNGELKLHSWDDMKAQYGR